MIGLRKRKKRTVLRKDRHGASPAIVGGVVLAVIAVATFLGFTKHIPFTHGYKLDAVFQSAVSIRKNSPVRIAGVNVGKVVGTKRQPGTDASIVEMELKKDALPIHKDATLKIRPRIFLEGNFFVDVQPGTPSAPTLSSGDTIPMAQTSDPVQLDEVLTALQADSRTDLQNALEGFGTALTAKPTAAEDAAQDPAVRGKSAAQAINQSFVNTGKAFRDTSVVNEALLGTEPHDLSGLIAGLGTVTHALDRNESQLQDLVTNFNTTMAAFAAESTPLRSSIRQLGPTLQTANRALTSLNASFPVTRTFSREILPGVRATPGTIDAGFPWITQTNRLLSEPELRGLVSDLRPTTANLAKVVNTTRQFLPQADLVAQCATKVVLPTGDIKIDEGSLSTGRENYKEFWYAMVGLAGEGQNFDGNGQYVRFQTGGGDQSISTGKVGGSAGDILYGNVSNKPLGTRPAYPGKRPPYNSTKPCKDDPIPDLNGAAVGPADGGGPGTTPTQPGGQVGQIVSTVTGAAGSAAGTATGVIGGLGLRKGDDGSLTSQLVDRLNPFRKTKAGRKP